METTRTKETIALEMANYFTSNITIVDFLNWAASATYKVDEAKDIDKQLKRETIFFTSYCITNMATSIMLCKTDKEKKEAIQKEVLSLFGGLTDKLSRQVMHVICEAYLQNFVKYNGNKEEIDDFFKVFHPLMNLCEMFRTYEELKKEEWEQESKAA